MKTKTLFAYCSVLSIIITSNLSVHAGEYHAPKERTQSVVETLACGQCHTMHGTEGGQSMIYSGVTAVYKGLLRAATALDLCLYCHGSASPAVNIEGNKTPPQIVNNTSYTPSAGDFKSGGQVNNPNRHNVDDAGGIDVSTTPPPGYTGTWTGAGSVTGKFGVIFNCLYCHDQHGNANFRNLRYDPGTPANDSPTNGSRVSVTYSLDTTNTTVDVNNTISANNLTKYYRANVSFRRAPIDSDTTRRGISAWCGKCHTNFWGWSGASNMSSTTVAPNGAIGPGDDATSNPWIRHPVDDAYIGGASLHSDYSGLGTTIRYDVGTIAGVTGDEVPNCLSCHYAHGGGNATATGNMAVNHSNLVMIDGAGRLNIGDINYIPPDNTTNANAARMRNVCQQCHNQ